MKLFMGVAAVAMFTFCSTAQAEDFEPSPVGPDAAAHLAHRYAPVIGGERYRMGHSVILGETIRRPLSFRRNPLLTLAEREALALRRAAAREAVAAQ